MRATRKPAKGGLPNAMFVQATVEDLPDEFTGIASEIHINFPWGSLLKSVVAGDASVLASLHSIARPGCRLEIIVGLDPVRDKSEIERLALPELKPLVLHSYLIPTYHDAGFELEDHGWLGPREWGRVETSWARKLQGGSDRTVLRLVFRA